jgi:hypothetical protein
MINHLTFLKTNFLCVCCFLFAATAPAQNNFTVKFINTANGKKIVLNDSIYYTPSGEPYTISKLKYYITYKDQAYLIDAAGDDSMIVYYRPNPENIFPFLLGVDSLHNCSGAQDGALDPLNDMFWAWNSGYIMFKLEGKSDSSHADLHRIEHHIGGFRGANKTMRPAQVSIRDVRFDGTHTTIFIEMNLDYYWHSINEIKISETPVIVTAGALAKKSADNFPQMFTIKSVE